MVAIEAIEGDITKAEVDAIVIGVDDVRHIKGKVSEAVHKAAGPGLLTKCQEKYPHGFAVGDAGWTDAGFLPAKHVVYVRVPIRNPNDVAASHAYLERAFRRGLETAAILGAKSVAVSLMGGGSGYSLYESSGSVGRAIREVPDGLEKIVFVLSTPERREAVEAAIAFDVPQLLLKAIRVLHNWGYTGVHVLSGYSPSGCYVRVSISSTRKVHEASKTDLFLYSSGSLGKFYGERISNASSPEEIARMMLRLRPQIMTLEPDMEWAHWFAQLMAFCAEFDCFPVGIEDTWGKIPPGWRLTSKDGRSLYFPFPPGWDGYTDYEEPLPEGF